MELKFEINNQKLRRVDQVRTMASHSVDYLTAKFTFLSSEWENIDKYVIFKAANGNNYNVYLGTSCTATITIPYPVLEGDHFMVSCYGGDRITTTRKTIVVKCSGFTEDITPVGDYETDVFSQFLELIHDRVDGVTFSDGVLSFTKDGEEFLSAGMGEHSHTASNVTDFEEEVGVEVKYALNCVANLIMNGE